MFVHYFKKQVVARVEDLFAFRCHAVCVSAHTLNSAFVPAFSFTIVYHEDLFF